MLLLCGSPFRRRYANYMGPGVLPPGPNQSDILPLQASVSRQTAAGHPGPGRTFTVYKVQIPTLLDVRLHGS